MKQKSEKKSEAKKDDINPVVAGAAGAVVGAGIGVAAASAMNDEKTKKTVEQVVSAAKDKAMEYVDNMSQGQGEEAQKALPKKK